MQLTNILAVTDGTPQPEATGLPSEPITATPSPDNPLPPATSSQPSANPLHTVIYFDNVNNLLPDLNRVDKQLRNYYSLGFQPERPGRGRVHSLEVKIDRPTLQVLHRQSFADLPWAERMGDRLQALLANQTYWDNPLGVQVETLEVEEAARGLFGVATTHLAWQFSTSRRRSLLSSARRSTRAEIDAREFQEATTASTSISTRYSSPTSLA